MQINLTNGKRTAEFAIRANTALASLIARKLREKYRLEGYRVDMESLEEYTHVIAVTSIKWRPAPKHLLRAVPEFIDGLRVGYSAGFIDGRLENPEIFMDQAPNMDVDILTKAK